MPNFGFTDFSQRRGSPFKNKSSDGETEDPERENIATFEVAQDIVKNKQIRSDLLEKANKMSAEIALNKPTTCGGVFTEVTTCGAFTAPKTMNKTTELRKSPQKSPPTQTNPSISLMGFPSSANTIALDAKADLESDPNISSEVKEKVILKLFALATMVQSIYESKVRVVSEYEKYKEKHLRDELRREKEQSEQLYKMNMSFQSEVVQTIQQLKMDLGAASGTAKGMEDEAQLNDTSTTMTNIPENSSSVQSHAETGQVYVSEMTITDHTEV